MIDPAVLTNASAIAERFQHATPFGMSSSTASSTVRRQSLLADFLLRRHLGDQACKVAARRSWSRCQGEQVLCGVLPLHHAKHSWMECLR